MAAGGAGLWGCAFSARWCVRCSFFSGGVRVKPGALVRVLSAGVAVRTCRGDSDGVIVRFCQSRLAACCWRARSPTAFCGERQLHAGSLTCSDRRRCTRANTGSDIYDDDDHEPAEPLDNPPAEANVPMRHRVRMIEDYAGNTNGDDANMLTTTLRSK